MQDKYAEKTEKKNRDKNCSLLGTEAEMQGRWAIFARVGILISCVCCKYLFSCSWSLKVRQNMLCNSLIVSMLSTLFNCDLSIMPVCYLLVN